MKNRVLVENSLIWNVHIAILNSTFRIQFYITIWKKKLLIQFTEEKELEPIKKNIRSCQRRRRLYSTNRR